MTDFNSEQKRFLRKLQGRLPLYCADKKNAEAFTLEYIAFEAQARRVWHYYRCRKKSKNESRAGIPLGELEKALVYFEVKMDLNLLKLLLDSKLAKRGMKSARNLRNGIFHQWLEKDCKEASQRYGEFSRAFEVFQRGLKQRL